MGIAITAKQGLQSALSGLHSQPLKLLFQKSLQSALSGLHSQPLKLLFQKMPSKAKFQIAAAGGILATTTARGNLHEFEFDSVAPALRQGVKDIPFTNNAGDTACSSPYACSVGLYWAALTCEDQTLLQGSSINEVVLQPEAVELIEAKLVEKGFVYKDFSSIWQFALDVAAFVDAHPDPAFVLKGSMLDSLPGALTTNPGTDKPLAGFEFIEDFTPAHYTKRSGSLLPMVIFELAT